MLKVLSSQSQHFVKVINIQSIIKHLYYDGNFSLFDKQRCVEFLFENILLSLQI